MAIKTKLTKVKFFLHENSPSITFWGGLGGMVAGAVMACKSTINVNKSYNEMKLNIDELKQAMEYADNEDDISDIKELQRREYLKFGKTTVKEYAIPVAIGSLSAFSLFTSHRTLKKRNLGLAGACAALSTALEEYRGRVKAKYGEDEERRLYNNVEEVEIEETIVNDKGKEKKVKKKIEVMHGEPSMYARFFDEFCDGWDPDPSITIQVLKAKEAWANDLLKSQGYLFLNDVYKLLGLPICDVGQDAGWIYDPENPIGDNYVSFGICGDYYRPNNRFVNGYEQVCLLDFNVDGNIRKKFMKYL